MEFRAALSLAPVSMAKLMFQKCLRIRDPCAVPKFRTITEIRKRASPRDRWSIAVMSSPRACPKLILNMFYLSCRVLSN